MPLRTIMTLQYLVLAEELLAGLVEMHQPKSGSELLGDADPGRNRMYLGGTNSFTFFSQSPCIWQDNANG